MEQLKGKELAEEVAYAINSFGFSAKDFCEQMHREHRTLQQNFMRLVLEYIKSTAEQDMYDERNEASVVACRKLAKLIHDEHITLPYI